jgi:hypothetical protein
MRLSQLVTQEGILAHREGMRSKAPPTSSGSQSHATSLKRLSKVEDADDPTDGDDQ